MEDMAGKISQLLSDPQGLNRIKSLAENLFSNKNDDNISQSNDSQDTSLNGFSLPEGFDPVKLMSIFSTLQNSQNDRRSDLLLALKPHLTSDRQSRVDKAVRLLKIASLIPALKNEGLLDLF